MILRRSRREDRRGVPLARQARRRPTSTSRGSARTSTRSRSATRGSRRGGRPTCMVDATARKAAFVGAAASVPPGWAAVAATAPELTTLIVLQSRMIVGLHLLYGGELDPEERALEVVAGLAAGAGLSVGRRLTVRVGRGARRAPRREGRRARARAPRPARRDRGVGGAQLRRRAGGGPGGRRARGAAVGPAGDPGARAGPRRRGAGRVTRGLAPADVVVAGGGLAAAAIALELARRDLTVDLLCRRGRGHPVGARRTRGGAGDRGAGRGATSRPGAPLAPPLPRLALLARGGDGPVRASTTSGAR